MPSSRRARSASRHLIALTAASLLVPGLVGGAPAATAATVGDDFERPDSPTLGSGWVTPSWSTDLVVSSGAAVSTSGARSALASGLSATSASVDVESLTRNVEFSAVSLGVDATSGEGMFVKLQSQDSTPGYEVLFAYQGVQGSPHSFGGGPGRFTIPSVASGRLQLDRDGHTLRVRVTPDGATTPVFDQTLTFADVAYGDSVAITSYGGGRITAFGTVAVADTVTFTSSVPTPLYPSQEVPLAATTASGEPVTFSALTPDTCSVSGAVLTAVSPGTCTVQGDSTGGATRSPGTATQDLEVSAIPTTVDVVATPGTGVAGQPITPAATVSAPVGSPSGTVTFLLDGVEVGSGTVDAGRVSAPVLTPTVGSHVLRAEFVPDSATTTASSGESTLVVDRAATATAVTLTSGTDGDAARVVVSPTAPGAGTPTGTVQLLVAGRPVGGPVPLTGGSVTVPVRTANGEAIAATYSGDDSFLGSAGSTSRSNPTITAHLTSARAPRHGWYRDPVTITFTCDTAGSTATTACPDPVTLAGDGAAQLVTRTLTTVDGGVASVSVQADVDTTGPEARLVGIVLSHVSRTALRRIGVSASDDLSGVSVARVWRTRITDHKVKVGAVAIDRAGNATRISRILRVR